MAATTDIRTRRIDTCPECNSRVRTEDGEAVCEHCGLVVDDRPLDHGPDWRYTSDPDDSERRTGAPLTHRHANRGLSTWMGSCDRDGKGNSIDHGKRRRLRRQRTRQRRAAADATKETLSPGLKEVDRLCSELELTDPVAETASVTYRRAVEESLLYGWCYEGIASAAVYIAARNTGAVRTLSEVVAVSYRPERPVARAVRHLQRELGLAVEPPAVTEYVPTVGDDLGLSERVQRLACDLLDAAMAENIHSGRDPSALAASALYTVTLAVEGTPPLCQTDVSAAVDVCPLTVRSHFRELRRLCPAVFDVSPSSIQSPKSRSGRRASRQDDRESEAATAEGCASTD